MEEHVSVYLDDIIIHSSAEDHLKIIEEVFKRLEEANLVVNESKCAFGRRKIEYLGYQIEHGKISALSDKVESVRRWPAPNSKKGVRRFLGAFNQYRRFIPKAANLVEPLQLLLRKRIEFDWGKDQIEAFGRVKEELANLPSLAPPQLGKQFVIYTDASDTGIGGVIEKD